MSYPNKLKINFLIGTFAQKIIYIQKAQNIYKIVYFLTKTNFYYLPIT